ncbi:MAG: hypothetical protein MI919_32045, partial [Holophagales bacterium]|nr:hypothetical protein [Holophagales bacterium]
GRDGSPSRGGRRTVKPSAEPLAPEASAAALEDLARRMRGSLASLRAAAEALDRFPGMEMEQRQRLRAVVADESEHLAELVRRLEGLARGSGSGARMPVGVAELLGQLASAFAVSGLEVGTPGWGAESDEEERPAGEPASAASSTAPSVPVYSASGVEALAHRSLDLDVPTLLAATRGFAAALRRDFATVRCSLSAEEVDGYLLVDGSWQPDPADAQRLQDWQGDALEVGRNAPSLRATARAQGGEAWFDLDRETASGSEAAVPERFAHLRILLPLAAASSS